MKALAVGASLAARSRTRIKSIFTKEGTKGTEERRLFSVGDSR